MKKNLSQKELVSFITYLSTYLDLTTKMKRVWKYLKKLHGIQQFVFPCLKTIARECRCCVDTARRAVRRFQELGWLVRIRRPYCSNRYVLDRLLVQVEVGPNDNIAIKNLNKFEKEYFEKYPPVIPGSDDDDSRDKNGQISGNDQHVSFSTGSSNYNRREFGSINREKISPILQQHIGRGVFSDEDLLQWSKFPESVLRDAFNQAAYVHTKIAARGETLRNPAALLNKVIYKLRRATL